MTNKDFSGIKTDRVFNSIEQSVNDKGIKTTAGPKEKQERASKLKTQGRKGCKAVRINMAFTPENHTFIKVMAKATGNSLTEFTNKIIAAYRNEHPEMMQNVQQVLEYAEYFDQQLELVKEKPLPGPAVKRGSKKNGKEIKKD